MAKVLLYRITIETLLSFITLLLCFISSIIVFNSNNQLAMISSDISPVSVWNTNLFCATWVSFAFAAFLFADLFTADDVNGIIPMEHKSANGIERGWILMLFASIAVLTFGYSVLINPMCGVSSSSSNIVVCRYSLSSVVTGVLGVLTSLSYLAASAVHERDCLRGKQWSRRKLNILGLALNAVTIICYTTNVILTTSSSGPGSDPSNLYFSSWLCFGMALYLCAVNVRSHFDPNELIGIEIMMRVKSKELGSGSSRRKVPRASSYCSSKCTSSDEGENENIEDVTPSGVVHESQLPQMTGTMNDEFVTDLYGNSGASSWGSSAGEVSYEKCVYQRGGEGREVQDAPYRAVHTSQGPLPVGTARRPLQPPSFVDSTNSTVNPDPPDVQRVPCPQPPKRFSDFGEDAPSSLISIDVKQQANASANSMDRSFPVFVQSTRHDVEKKILQEADGITVESRNRKQRQQHPTSHRVVELKKESLMKMERKQLPRSRQKQQHGGIEEIAMKNAPEDALKVQASSNSKRRRSKTKEQRKRSKSKDNTLSTSERTKDGTRSKRRSLSRSKNSPSDGSGCVTAKRTISVHFSDLDKGQPPTPGRRTMSSSSKPSCSQQLSTRQDIAPSARPHPDLYKPKTKIDYLFLKKMSEGTRISGDTQPLSGSLSSDCSNPETISPTPSEGPPKRTSPYQQRHHDSVDKFSERTGSARTSSEHSPSEGRPLAQQAASEPPLPTLLETSSSYSKSSVDGETTSNLEQVYNAARSNSIRSWGGWKANYCNKGKEMRRGGSFDSNDMINVLAYARQASIDSWEEDSWGNPSDMDVGEGRVASYHGDNLHAYGC